MAATFLSTTAGNVLAYSSLQGATTVHGLGRVEVDSGGVIIAKRPWYVDVTPSLYTSATQAGRVIAATEILAACAPANDVNFRLTRLEVLDIGHATVSFDVWLLKSNVAMGTEGSAISITDGDAIHVIDYVQFFTTEAKDLIGSFFYRKGDLNIPLTPVTGSDDIYFAIVCTEGTPTLGASNFKMRFWFES
jgi:hypothetical protein